MGSLDYRLAMNLYDRYGFPIPYPSLIVISRLWWLSNADVDLRKPERCSMVDSPTDLLNKLNVVK